MTTYVGTQVGSAPYRAVAYIEATFPNGQTYTGSGYLVGPNDVLTASHVVYSVADGGLATSVTVYAGRDGASQPYGAVQGQRIDYFQTDLDGDGLFTRSDSEDDFAVIGLGTRLGDSTGTFTLDPNATTGTYHLTGYPGVYADSSGPRMTDDVGTATENSTNFVFDLTSIEANSGNSGGPLWYVSGGVYYGVGVLSTGGWASDVAAHYSTLIGWISGNDTLISGTSGTLGTTGNDTMIGGVGADTIFGLDGNDVLSGGSGDDILYGNKGLDQLIGGDGNDTLFGGQNSGTESGSPLALRDGIETVSGGDGDDMLFGNHGSDLLFGGNGGDTIYGGQDADTLYGEASNDVLVGNLGNDVLSGGSGGDHFYFAAGSGADTIQDMTYSATDSLRDLIYIQSNVNGSGITTSASVLSHIADNASGQAVIDLGGGNSITIANHNTAWFVSTDFVIF
jgi:Ca2+-binding RTX toxin-like protein